MGGYAGRAELRQFRTADKTSADRQIRGGLIMATKKVYDACCRKLQSMSLSCINSRGESKLLLKPDMYKLFGEKLIVDESKLLRCGEVEKRRHLYEDKVLRLLYLENQSYVGFGVEK